MFWNTTCADSKLWFIEADITVEYNAFQLTRNNQHGVSYNCLWEICVICLRTTANYGRGSRADRYWYSGILIDWTETQKWAQLDEDETFVSHLLLVVDLLALLHRMCGLSHRSEYPLCGLDVSLWLQSPTGIISEALPLWRHHFSGSLIIALEFA